jgi:2-polyprenyl-6-methoxyphenol hydroxylase-like FAD-dependent oxidoreductase
MTLPTQVDVAIVGAGPTGLTLACELARRGVSIALVETRAEPQRLSKALGVHARTLEVFEDLGLAGEAVSRGRKLAGATIYSDGDPIAEVTLDHLNSRYAFVLVLPQWETETLLEGRLGELGARVHREASATSARTFDDRVEIDVVRGGQTSVITASWLVGCGGAHSLVRDALGVSFAGAAYEETFALADVSIRWDRDPHCAHAFLGSDGLAAVFPLPDDGRARIVADLDDTDPKEPTVELFEDLLRRRGARDVSVFDASWLSRFRIHRRLAGSYRVGRCFIAGDAAHVHSPVGGQGMNTGIQDAYNLGWKLAAVLQGHASEQLLDSYEAERRPVARATLRGTDVATRLGMIDRPLARAIRGRMASFLTTLGPVRDRITRAVAELDVNYRRSPIVREDTGRGLVGGLGERIAFARGPKPGERCPDVVTRGGRGHLHEWLHGPLATLLIFATSPAELNDASLVAHAVLGELHDQVRPVLIVATGGGADAVRWDGKIIVDTEGEVARTFGAVFGCLYLIRPDGYVGFRCDRLDARLVTHFIDSLR